MWFVNRGKATPSPLPLRHRPHLRRGGETSAFSKVTRAAEGELGGCITLPSLSPVAPSTEGGDTGGLRSQPEAVTSAPAPPPPTAASPAADVLSDTAFEEWIESDRLDIPAQEDNPRSQPRRQTVTPAVTRSVARTQLGVGDQPGAFAALSAKERIGEAIAPSAASHSDSPKLLTCPTHDLETSDTYAQAHAGPRSKI